jgi:hypothetical protein
MSASVVKARLLAFAYKFYIEMAATACTLISIAVKLRNKYNKSLVSRITLNM